MTHSGKICIFALGTSGDIFPFIAIAQELRSQGFDTTIASSSDFAEVVRSNGLQFLDLGTNIREAVHKRALSKSDFRHSKRSSFELAGLAWAGLCALREASERAFDLARSFDLLICHRNTTFCLDIGRQFRIQTIMAAFQPLHPTKAFAYCAFNWPHQFRHPSPHTYRIEDTHRGSGRHGEFLRGIYNQATYAVGTLQQSYFDLNRIAGRLRKSGWRNSGLARTRDWQKESPTLYAYSPSLVERPKDWPKHIVVTGAWLAEGGAAVLDSRTDEFLASGPPPLYLGFGSMPIDPIRAARLIEQALKLWGGRVIVGGGWADIKPNVGPEQVLVLPFVSHHALFPHVRGAIHHGGAGTVHTTLMHGLPSFVVPHFYDQNFWGLRINALGAGPRPVTFENLNPQILAQAMQLLYTHSEWRQNAVGIGQKIKQESGLANATSIIRSSLNSSSPPHWQ